MQLKIRSPKVFHVVSRFPYRLLRYYPLAQLVAKGCNIAAVCVFVCMCVCVFIFSFLAEFKEKPLMNVHENCTLF